MNELTGKTPDIAQENIEKLKTIFPDVFTEGKIDFEKLQQVLGNYIETSSERYDFTWNGKSQALRLAQTPSLGTLRPCKEESKDWETTENLYIEGDNLEVLKLLQKSYHGKVKMIYIDPPYNTGKDFVYPDNFKDSIENYKTITGQLDEQGNMISSNSETSGRYHTDWLNMMYPRLRLARNLLTEDGVVFVSIDDNEQDNLKKVCNEVFGESNFIGCVTREAKTTSFRGKYFAPSKDYLLCFSKNIEIVTRFSDDIDINQFPKTEQVGSRKGEKYRDDIAFYLSTLETRPNQRYFIECPDGQKVIPPGTTFPPAKPIEGDGVWRWNKNSFNEKRDLIVFKQTKRSPLIDEDGNQANWNIYTKSYLIDKQDEGNIPRDVFRGFLNRNGSEDLKKLNIPFSFPKPVKLVNYLMKIIQVNKNAIVLDFFSGSATTAHAVMQLNAEDQGNRKFIMVQFPEPCDGKSEAYKAGYVNICEIGKERIRRAGEKIKEDAGLIAADLDIGFKVFKLDTSNIRKWQPDYNNIEQSLVDYVENYVEGRSELDVVYEIMLKCGLDLTYGIDEYSFEGRTVYAIGFGALMICLADDITSNMAQEMVKLKHQLSPETWKVVFRDNGFKSDSDKINIKEILKCGGLDEDAFTTL